MGRAMTEILLDKIHIRDLSLRCVIGITEDERREKQDVNIDVTLRADLRQAGRTDRIEDTVNYKVVEKRIVSLVEGSSCFLVERLAAEIAAVCLEDPRVAQVKVRVAKPGALRFARSVDAEIVRRRDER